MVVKLKKSPPWVAYVNKLKVLFEHDPGVNVTEKYMDDHIDLRIGVPNKQKYDAFTQFLPEYKDFGAFRVNLEVYVIEDQAETDIVKLLKEMFDGNEAISEITTLSLLVGEATYVEFNPWVAQYYDDNTGDLYGNTSTLYADIAKEVLEVPAGIFFCTAPVNAPNTP